MGTESCPGGRIAPGHQPARRRALGRLLRVLGAACGASLYLPVGAVAAAAAGEASVTSGARIALLLGNRRYPEPFDLPPVPKNVRDLKQALIRVGFAVTDVLDVDLAASRSDLAAFARAVAAAPDDATVLFYYAGHGAQVDAANLLVPAGLSPAADADRLRDGSVQLLRDVIGALPPRPRGMVIAIVDACRTTLKSGEGGLNQVEAPTGCLIAFSTGAGRPAIAPSSPDQNTFYTAALVRQLEKVREETTFAELFQLVRADVRNTMLNHPVAAIRKLAQDPFIADHTTRRPLVLLPQMIAASPPPAPPPAAASGAVCTPASDPRFGCQEEQDAWAALGEALWPGDVSKLAEAFTKAYPDSRFRGKAEAALEGARSAVQILQRPAVHLYRSAFKRDDSMSAEEREDIERAARGDKDAAARQGRRHAREAEGSGPLRGRYEGWMQYAAALGNGIASYELSKYYATAGQPALESEYETRARELGYNPPPTLDNKRSETLPPLPGREVALADAPSRNATL